MADKTKPPRQQHIVINQPMYDIKCRYFNSAQGCHYGDYCRCKHIVYYKQHSKYDVLIEYHKLTNVSLNNVLSLLQTITGNDSNTVPSKPTTQAQPALETGAIEPVSLINDDPAHR